MTKSNQELQQDILNQLAWDTRVSINDIEVKVKNSTAILTGSVPNFTQKSTATSITHSILGIINVDNRLTVQFPSSDEIPTDEDIRKTVKRLLKWNADVKSSTIHVSVENGIVTLEGSVSSFWEKIQAEEEVYGTGGVTDIINKLAVVPTDNVSDEIIGERIIDRIATNSFVDVERINVQVRNGKVTLTGIVPGHSTRSSVYDSARFTQGVTDVRNSLVVSYT